MCENMAVSSLVSKGKESQESYFTGLGFLPPRALKASGRNISLVIVFTEAYNWLFKLGCFETEGTLLMNTLEQQVKNETGLSKCHKWKEGRMLYRVRVGR